MHGSSIRLARVVVAVVAAGFVLALPMAARGSPAAPGEHTRQQAFDAAAGEFGVPASVLLGVSYLESRWDANGGAPSTAAGYGPMHLTDLAAANWRTHHDHGTEDPRGDDSRPALRPTPAKPVETASSRTVHLAAQLTGTAADVLRTNPAQNIRGGAALLAHYQRELGGSGTELTDWFGAVARYAGPAAAKSGGETFATEVFATIATGAERVTDDGQRVRLAAHPEIATKLTHRRPREPAPGLVECPPELSCEWLPAPKKELPAGEYGNHDLGQRPNGQAIEYLVIHDTEGTWDGALGLVQQPSYVSWHYTLRSHDGHIAQHLQAKDVGWHAGNWYVNAKSIGLEHEGYATEGTWYTEAMYRTSAKLVRYLAAKYHIPLDRAHILGHDNVPGTIPSTVAGMHWDPGPYWDWAHYFDLLGAPIRGTDDRGSDVVTIRPNFTGNKTAFLGCDQKDVNRPCPAHASSTVILQSEPRSDAPLLADIGLRPEGAPSTMGIHDVGSRVSAGQQYVVAERRGDWTAIWYLGQKGWFRNPPGRPNAVSSRGLVVTPKPGIDKVPLYGRAYPEPTDFPSDIPAREQVPLNYTLPAGQRYVAGLVTGAEYYWAATFDATRHSVVMGDTRYIQIQYGHRVAFVNVTDVLVLPIM